MTRSAFGILTDASQYRPRRWNDGWIDEFRENGFVVFKDALPEPLIDAHLSECNRIQQSHGLMSKIHACENTDCRAELLRQAMAVLDGDNPLSHRLHLNPATRTRVSRLFDDTDPILLFSRTTLWEHGRAPHVDTMMVYRDPPDKICRTWSALEDIHPDSGMFYVIAGSHRTVRPYLYDAVLTQFPEIRTLLRQLPRTSDETARPLRHYIWQKISQATASLTDHLPRHPFAIRKGDVVLFNPNVIHGTLPARNLALSRKAILAEWHARSVRTYPAYSYFGDHADDRSAESGELTANRAVRSLLGWFVPREDCNDV